MTPFSAGFVDELEKLSFSSKAKLGIGGAVLGGVIGTLAGADIGAKTMPTKATKRERDEHLKKCMFLGGLGYAAFGATLGAIIGRDGQLGSLKKQPRARVSAKDRARRIWGVSPKDVLWNNPDFPKTSMPRFLYDMLWARLTP